MSSRPPLVPCLIVVIPLEGQPSVRALTRDEENDRLVEWVMSRPRLAALLSALIELLREENEDG